MNSKQGDLQFIFHHFHSFPSCALCFRMYAAAFGERESDMSATEKFTSADLALMPDDGKRYEIIEGELYVSRQPGFEHQYTCGQLFRFLQEWNEENGTGVAIIAPGVIFADDEDVAPDVVWVSRERLADAVDKAGHLREAPELVIE